MSRSILVGIFALLMLYTLHFAASLLIPIALAYLVGLLLQRPMILLRRIGLPDALGAFLVVTLLLGLLSSAALLLAEPAGEWIAKVPSSLRQAERKLHRVKQPIERVREASREVEKATSLGEDGERYEIDLAEETWLDQLLDATPTALFSMAMIVFILYFFLASGNQLIRGIARASRDFGTRRRVLWIGAHINREISHYLLTVTLVNLALGIVIGTAMYAIGMPNPWLWGAFATILNYVPYLGAIIGFFVITLASTLTFSSPLEIVTAPLTYLALTSLEGHLVTPHIVGRRFALNPLVVFLAITFGGWLWGVAGVLMAVPLLVSFNIVCSQIPVLQGIPIALGGSTGAALDAPRGAPARERGHRAGSRTNLRTSQARKGALPRDS